MKTHTWLLALVVAGTALDSRAADGDKKPIGYQDTPMLPGD